MLPTTAMRTLLQLWLNAGWLETPHFSRPMIHAAFPAANGFTVASFRAKGLDGPGLSGITAAPSSAIGVFFSSQSSQRHAECAPSLQAQHSSNSNTNV